MIYTVGYSGITVCVTAKTREEGKGRQWTRKDASVTAGKAEPLSDVSGISSGSLYL